MDSVKRRIGLMGGTFDPIHIGHLMLAECAYEQFGLDEVLFLPSGNPPHKQDRTDGASDRERLEMVRLAVADNPHFAIDEEEMRRAGLTYTSETLRRLRSGHPENDYYFIIGADSLATFDTWKNPESICRNCILAVAARDKMPFEELESRMEELRRRFGATIYLLRTPDVEIASSNLRSMVRDGHSIRYFVPDSVRQYIETHQIYGNTRVEE